MDINSARKIAETLVEEMTPYCEKIIIAGSIRRGKPEVKDIEIVAVPRWDDIAEHTGDLFEPVKMVPQNELYHWALRGVHGIQWIKPGTHKIIPWLPKENGKYWRGLIELGDARIKLDLFLANPDNFGAISVIRTGPAEFSSALMAHLKHNTKYRVQDGHLTIAATGTIVGCSTEESFFENAGLKWIPVADRSASDLYSLFKKVENNLS